MNSDNDTALRFAALGMASARLATGFLRCIQTDNKCDVTGRACHDKCGCLEELKNWCKE